MQNKIPMHRRKYGKRALKLPELAAFDIETEGLGGDFILGAIVTSDGTRVLVHSLEDLLQFMLDNPDYRYLAHNASGYEFAYLYPLIYDHFEQNEEVAIETTMQMGTKIIQIRIYPDKEDKKHYIDMRDTLCLFGMSLKKVAEAFCPELPKLTGNIDFEKEIFDPHNPLHVEYLWRDCDVIIEAYTKHAANMRDVFASPLGITAPSTALKSFYATIPQGYVYYRLKPKVEEFIRKSYYGGLCLPGHKVGEWVEDPQEPGDLIGCIDINGAYAYQMKIHEFPVGAPVRGYHKDDVGFYEVIATVPEDCYDKYGFNPVPYRDKTGLKWPSGVFHTYITSVEYEFAKECGCTFFITDAYSFPITEKVFEEYIDKCQEMELFNDGIYKPSVKLCRNGLYGKFGSKTEHKSLVFSREILTVNDGYQPLTVENDGTIISDLYTRDEKSDADYMLPHWAALITAYQRVYIMKFIKLCKERGAEGVYCDTDSIKTKASIILDLVKEDLIPTGSLYGQFKIEGFYSSFIVLGTKCFTGRNIKGKDEFKAKGIPNKKLSRRLYILAINNRFRTQSFDSIDTTLTLMKKRTTIKPLVRERKITNIRFSAGWDIDKEKLIHPVKVVSNAYEMGNYHYLHTG